MGCLGVGGYLSLSNEEMDILFRWPGSWVMRHGNCSFLLWFLKYAYCSCVYTNSRGIQYIHLALESGLLPGTPSSNPFDCY